MRVSRMQGRYCRWVIGLAGAVVLVGCGSEMPTAPTPQGWEVAKSRGRAVVNPEEYLVAAGCTASTGGRGADLITITPLLGTPVQFRCTNVDHDSITAAVGRYFAASEAANGDASMMAGTWRELSQTWCRATNGGWGADGIWELGVGGQWYDCEIRYKYEYDEGSGGFGSLPTMNIDYPFAPPSGGGGGGSTTVPPPPPATVHIDTVAITLLVDGEEADSLPVCKDNNGVLQFQMSVSKATWCNSPNAEGVQSAAIQAAITRMHEMGGECAPLADLLQTALDHQNIHVGRVLNQFGQVMNGMGVSGSRSANDGADQAYITIHPDMIEKYYNKSKRVVLANGVHETEATLQSILAHEADHSLYGFDLHLSTNSLQTPHSQSCSDLGVQ